MKRLLKYLIVLIVLLTAGLIAAYFLAKKYEPEVTKAVISRLNKHLQAEVSVEDINLSLTQRFPYASVRLSNVVIPETGEGFQPGDTLLYIKDLYLQIGLIDFLKKDYSISDADIKEGFFRMRYDEQGRENFRFWKSASDSTASTALTIQNVYIEDFEYGLIRSEDLAVALFINTAKASGNFGNDKYDIELETEAQLKSLYSKKELFYQDETINGELKLQIDNPNKTYKFQSKGIELANEKYSIDGQFRNSDLAEWKLQLNTTKADLLQALHLLPLDIRNAMENYKFSGKTGLDIDLTANEDFSVDILFSELSGSFSHKMAPGKARVRPSTAKLAVRNRNVSLDIEKLDAKIGPGEILAVGEIENLKRPRFNLNLKGNVDLQELKGLMNITSVERMEGRVSLDGTLNGSYTGGAAQERIKFLKGIGFDGNIDLSRGAFKLKDRDEEIEEIEGKLNLDDNRLIVESGSASLNNSHFELSGTIYNVLPYIISEREEMRIEANFTSEYLDFNEIWNSSSTDTTYSFKLPENISFNLDLNIGKIDFRRFQAQSVQGKAYYKNGVLSLNPLNFETSSGLVKASGLISQESEKLFTFQTNALLTEISLDELFFQFEDFGQNVIQSKHISGTTDARIELAGAFSNSLQINGASIVSSAEIEVSNGELNDLEALRQIADYLREKALWNTLVKVDAFEKELRHIEFGTLYNRIEIRNRVITIPDMEINSSALNLDLNGTHSFDQEIDYTIRFRLAELLRKGKKANDEFGYITDDGTGLNVFLKMEGTTFDPEFSLDKDAAREKRKEQFEEEKSTFKGILKEEFGLFKKDTTVVEVPKQDKPRTEFEVDVKGLDQKSDSLKKAEEKKKKDKKDEGWDDLDDDDDI